MPLKCWSLWHSWFCAALQQNVIPLMSENHRKDVWALKREQVHLQWVAWGEEGKWQCRGCAGSWAAEHSKCFKYQMCKLKLPQGSLILWGGIGMVHKPSRNRPWQLWSNSSGTSCSEHFIACGAYACCTADLGNVSWLDLGLISPSTRPSCALSQPEPAFQGIPPCCLGFVVLGSTTKPPSGGAGGGWSSLRAAEGKKAVSWK